VTISAVHYNVQAGKIHNTNPGVFFYWVAVTVPAGSNSFTITQTITTANFTGKFNLQSGGSGGGNNVFDSSCNSVSNTITQDPTTKAATAQWNAPTAGTYYIALKYNTSSVVGQPAPSPTTVHYNFMTTGVPGSTSVIDLVTP
jgi:hypothetical protein